MSQTGWPSQRASVHRHRNRAATPSTPILPWDSGADPPSSRKLAAELWHLRFDEIPAAETLAPPQAVESSVRRSLNYHRAAEGSLVAENRSLRRKVKRLLERLGDRRGCDAAEERRRRRRAEAVNARLVDRVAEAELAGEMLARRCAEERRRREASEELARRRAAEVEEERRMLEVAEAWREERVQMKLADARLALEDGFARINLLVSDLDSLLRSPAALTPARQLLRAAAESFGGGGGGYTSESSDGDDNGARRHNVSPASAAAEEEQKRLSACGDDAGKLRRAPENPHIARGMKGRIEWPRAAVPRSVFKAKISEAIIDNHKSQLRHVYRPRT